MATTTTTVATTTRTTIGTDDRADDRVSEVRGRVDRVDTSDEIIYVEASDVYRSDLRNGSDEIPIYYDDQTEVEYDGKTYEPSALEEGDRVVVDVDDTGSRLYARDIEVTYDVTAGDRDDDYDATTTTTATRSPSCAAPCAGSIRTGG